VATNGGGRGEREGEGFAGNDAEIVWVSLCQGGEATAYIQTQVELLLMLWPGTEGERERERERERWPADAFYLSLCLPLFYFKMISDRKFPLPLSSLSLSFPSSLCSSPAAFAILFLLAAFVEKKEES
jgi:hypothetical protein